MLVEIDVDRLVLEAATIVLANEWKHEKSAIVDALQEQVPGLIKRVRQQVKEYKALNQG